MSKKYKKKYKYVKHVVNDMDNGIQRCIICGKIITDYTYTMYLGDTPPSGFPAGELYVSVLKNPEIFLQTHDEEGMIVENCSNII